MFQLRKRILEKSKDGSLKSSNGDAAKGIEPRKRGRWDQTVDDQFISTKKQHISGSATPLWGEMDVS